MSVPMVSICCITFNHFAYIKQALDGFLMQECEFDFEILIHDDASTDGTSEIIRAYQANYPGIVKPIIQEKNQWSQGVRGMNATYNVPRAKGKYMAMCEGDDYWTDPLKLQKQVDFLENNLHYSFCFHDALEVHEKTGKNFVRIGSRKIDAVVDLKSVIIENNFPTASLLFHKKFYVLKRDVLSATAKGDYLLVLRLAEKGLGKYLPEVMSAYRIHEGGVWSTKSADYKLNQDMNFYDLLYDYFEDSSIRKIIIQKRNKTIESLSLIYLREGQFWKGMQGVIKHRNFTSDARLKGASIRKILSAVKSGLGKF